MPTLLTRSEAIRLCPEGISFKDYYGSRILQQWDDDLNDSRTTDALFQPRHEDLPWIIDFNGKQYRQGQTTGMANSTVWYDLIEH